MPLTTCRECKREVSDSTKTCPHCGVPNPDAKLAAIQGCSNIGCVLTLLVTVPVMLVLLFALSR